tara:strand:- start:3 stop:350 length:348 start_codon:yes stop_codon:yes gene_type:complete
MSEGDITKVYENDKIEVVLTWQVQVRKATIIKEEQADGSKLELTRKFHRHVIMPFVSHIVYGSDGQPELDSDGKKKWTHTATDISGEDADIQAICNAAWTDTVKNNYKTFTEETG